MCLYHADLPRFRISLTHSSLDSLTEETEETEAAKPDQDDKFERICRDILLINECVDTSLYFSQK
jgi:hypothetical protein